MRSNRKFADMVRPDVLQGVTQADIPRLFQAALDDGWVVDEAGAHLLKAFHRGYGGHRENFSDVTAYEAAVNGRAVPDVDLTEIGVARVQALVRRAYAFAWMALFLLREISGHHKVTAYVSVGPTLMDDNVYTANVTFCADHEAEGAYISQVDAFEGAALLALDSTECDGPLPA